MMNNIIILSLVLGVVFADKVYIPDEDKDIVGLSNSWHKPNSCGGSAWIYQNVPLSKVFYWTVCFSVNCLLETSTFKIKSVKTVFADITYQGRFCNLVDKDDKVPAGCVESISVNANMANNDKEDTFSGITTETEIKYPGINDKKKKDNNPKFFLSQGTFHFDNSKDKEFMRFLFNSTHTCGSVRNFTVYYYKCPSVTESLAEFGDFNAPSKVVGEELHEGKCIENAEQVGDKKLIQKCKWNGIEDTSGECHCKVGHEKFERKCLACTPDHFKPEKGNQKCTKCGKNALADHSRTYCNCMSGFKREKRNNDYTSECYEVPGIPSSVRIKNITDNSAVISWTHSPGNNVNAGTYTILCKQCPSGVFPITTKADSIKLDGLGAFATYQLKISYTNKITEIIGENSTTEFYDLKTEPGAPGKVQNLNQKTLQDGSVELTWDEPFAKGNDDIIYLVTYGGSTKKTKERNFVIGSDTQTRSYNVKVAAQVMVDGKEFTGPVSLTEEIQIKGGVALDLAVGAGVGAVIFVIVIAIIVFVIWRRRNPPYTQVVRMEDGTVKLPGRFYPGAKLYVDPTTYNDVDDAVTEFAFEVDQKSLTIGQLLGGGEFADVYKGTLFKNGKSKDVAIKTLKPNASKHDRDDFLSEAAIIGQFTDPNVITLEGVVLKERPNVIVLEYMANGALDKYLQKHDMQFTSLQLLGMARGVASGMKYLNELGFIHRDLAARNILVDEFRVCKVSDFGMSREIKVDETYDTQGGKIPVRWTAPESIQFKKFTTASDVWSYGILLWEIMSYGERPYWDWGNYEVLERLNQGYRLPPPMNCPKVIHDLMLFCWTKDRTKRPRMVEIRDQLEKWIRSPELLDASASVVTKTDENLDYTVLQTINKWLDAIGMGKYTENFLDKGYATPRQILVLTLEDLEELGVGPIGHRKKIFKAIQNTKAQVDQRHNNVSGTNPRDRKKTFSLPKKGSTS